MAGRARKLAVGMSLGLLAFAAAGGVPALGDALQPLGVTSPTRMTDDDARPTRAYQSPSLLVSPDDPDVAVAAALEMSSGTCSLFRSNDGGQSWARLEASPSPEAYPRCFQGAVYGYLNETPIAWGRDGTLYWGMTGLDPAKTEEDLSVLVARTDDLGSSWSWGTAFDGRDGEEARTRPSRPVTGLAVDTTTGENDIVYVGWETWPEAPRTLALIATSTDGGRTFSDPRSPIPDDVAQRLGGPEGFETLPPELEIGADGTLFVLLPGNPTTDGYPNKLLLARSDDQGETFAVAEVTTPFDANTTPSLQWVPEGGPGGTLHIVYEDRPEPPRGTREIYYQRSTDGGRSFSSPRRLNDDDPAQRFAHHNPRLAVAPGGRLDVTWWDFRDGAADYANDVYLTSSPDNGDTWSSNHRVTDRSIGRRTGYWSNGYDMRSPPAVASTDATAIFGWSDTRLAEGTELQDVYSAVVQMEKRPGDAMPWAYALAALGGLAAGGVVLLAASLVLRRRQAPERPRGPGASTDVHPRHN